MAKVSVRAKWLRFTEETNALDFLDKAARFIVEAQVDRKAWKWVVLCLQGALYGFAVCACRGTNYEDVVVRNKKGEEKLISFDKALEMCQNPSVMGTLFTSRVLDLSKSQKDSIRRLKKELRNNFEHYIPRGWSIEIHGMPKIAIDVLDVVRFLAVETGTYIHLNQAQMKKVKSHVYQSKRLLKKSRLYHEAQLAAG